MWGGEENCLAHVCLDVFLLLCRSDGLCVGRIILSCPVSAIDRDKSSASFDRGASRDCAPATGHALHWRIAVFPILADKVKVKKGSELTAHWSIDSIRPSGWLRRCFALLITPLDTDGIGQNWEDSNKVGENGTMLWLNTLKRRQTGLFGPLKLHNWGSRAFGTRDAVEN